MTWNEFIWFALPSAALWLSSAVIVYCRKCPRALADILMILGIGLFAGFITLFWLELERPPLRTMGETRLWYSLFIAIVGFLAYKKWKYKWLLGFTAITATIFVIINILKPELHSQNLMPALQSVWFVPHVISYILSYAMFGAATIGAIIGLSKKQERDNVFPLIDNMIYVGYGFLMLGLLMGAIWAKQAWGHYWSWDAKETWAFISSAIYLLYIHLRLNRWCKNSNTELWVAVLAFILLLITWLGVGYLTAAQGSIHVY